MRKSWVQAGLEQKIKIRSAIKVIAALTVVGAAVLLGAGAAARLRARGLDNDKYSLRSPGGIAFSDFKGYEDWSVVSSARTEDVLKVIVANPAMIGAYKVGTPGNGQSFPQGSMIVKLQWKPKKSTEAPFVVDVPDTFKQVFVMEKDNKRFPKTGGWGYAVYNYDAAANKFSADPSALQDCGQTCHVAVKAKDYIFHPYQKR
jgi:hypothetical protein